MSKSLLRRSGGTSLAKIAQAGLGLATALVLARLFGAETFGIYAYATTITTVIAIFTRGGFPLHLIFAVNNAISEARQNDVASILITAFFSSLFASIIAGLALYAVVLFIPHWQMAPALKFSAALVAVNALVQVAGGAMTALGRPVLGTCIEAVFKPILFLIGVAVCLLFWHPSEIGFDGLLEIFLITQFILVAFSIGATFYWVEREVGSLRFDWALAWPTIKEARPYMLANAMIRLYQDAGTTAVGIFFPATSVALFRVASQISALIPFGLQAMQAVLRPHIVRKYNQGNEVREELQAEITHLTRILALVQSPLMIATIFFAPWITWVFGQEFVGSAEILTVLAIGQTFSILCGLNGDVLTMTGRARISAQWSMLALILVVSLMWPLIQIFGIMGAALAVGISRVVWNAGLARAAVIHTGLHTTVLGVIRIHPKDLLPWICRKISRF